MATEDQKGLWEITTMPKVDDVDTATNYANNGGSSWYITSNCKNVELAEDFLASTFGSVSYTHLPMITKITANKIITFRRTPDMLFFFRETCSTIL